MVGRAREPGGGLHAREGEREEGERRGRSRARAPGGGLHALVRRDAVERVFVAPAAPAHLVLRPPAQLHRAVRGRRRVRGVNRGGEV